MSNVFDNVAIYSEVYFTLSGGKKMAGTIEQRWQEEVKRIDSALTASISSMGDKLVVYYDEQHIKSYTIQCVADGRIGYVVPESDDGARILQSIKKELLTFLDDADVIDLEKRPLGRREELSFPAEA